MTAAIKADVLGAVAVDVARRGHRNSRLVQGGPAADPDSVGRPHAGHVEIADPSFLAEDDVDIAGLARPGSADAATFACFNLVFAGYPEEAVPHGERAMSFSPHCPACYHGILGNACRLAGRTEEAIACFRAYHTRNPGFGLAAVAIIHQQTGRPDEARAAARELLGLRRDFTIAARARTQFRTDAAGLESDNAALRAAGVPEG